jgi:hypothetical protein
LPGNDVPALTPRVPPTPFQLVPRLVQCPAVITYRVPDGLRALKPEEQRAPPVVIA